MTPATDLELIEGFRRGDVACFNELVRRYQEKVYWIARRMVGTHEDADDAVQDVFVRVYEGLKNFRGESNFYTWVYRIAVNVSLNVVRKKRLRELLPYDDLLAETHPGDLRSDLDLERREFQSILERAIQRLPVKQRTVFTMRYYDELPFDAIAGILHRSVGGTKANYFHALRKISEFVRKEMQA